MKPGDLFWSTGSGLAGLFIRLGTTSEHGHCGVVTTVPYREARSIDGTKVKCGPLVVGTHEAHPFKGVVEGVRPVDSIAVTVAPDRPSDALDVSHALVGSVDRYDWWEIVRAVRWRARNRWRGTMTVLAAAGAAAAGWSNRPVPAAVLVGTLVGLTVWGIAAAVPIPTDRTDAQICSGHVGRVAAASVDGLELPYGPTQTWPGLIFTAVACTLLARRDS